VIIWVSPASSLHRVENLEKCASARTHFTRRLQALLACYIVSKLKKVGSISPFQLAKGLLRHLTIGIKVEDPLNEVIPEKDPTLKSHGFGLGFEASKMQTRRNQVEIEL
jgi:hypothetical protein